MNSGPQIALMEPVILQWCFEIALEGIKRQKHEGRRQASRRASPSRLVGTCCAPSEMCLQFLRSRLRCFFLAAFVNERVSVVGDLGEDEEIIRTKTGTILPVISVLVRSTERDIVNRPSGAAVINDIAPDCRFNRAIPDRMYRSIRRLFRFVLSRCCLGHNAPPVSLR